MQRIRKWRSEVHIWRGSEERYRRVILCVIRRTFLPFFFSFLFFFFFSGGVSLPWLATIHENLGFSVRRCAEHLKDWAEMAGAQGEAGKLGWRKCGWKPSDLIQGVIRNQASSSTATISFSCASEPCFQKLGDRDLFFSFTRLPIAYLFKSILGSRSVAYWKNACAEYHLMLAVCVGYLGNRWIQITQFETCFRFRKYGGIRCSAGQCGGGEGAASWPLLLWLIDWLLD